MPSNKDILEAQRFNRRRLVTAFTSGTPGGKELESKSTTRPLIVGASLAALAVLIAVAVGRFLPTLPSGWQDSHLIITKGEGARSKERFAPFLTSPPPSFSAKVESL